MQSLRVASIEVLKNISDSSTLEEIMYQLNLTSKVLAGLKDGEENKTISTEELLKKVNEWKQK